jgi:hypothetical protein
MLAQVVAVYRSDISIKHGETLFFEAMLKVVGILGSGHCQRIVCRPCHALLLSSHSSLSAVGSEYHPQGEVTLRFAGFMSEERSRYLFWC